MIGLLQRVSQAKVSVEGEVIAEICQGLLVLVGIEHGDGPRQADRLLERMLAYRVFADAHGRMNLGLREVMGGLLLIPQFTLAADTSRGLRPSFTPAADPASAAVCFEYLLERARSMHPAVAYGRFGAEMSVMLVNEGPVTFSLRVAPGHP